VLKGYNRDQLWKLYNTLPSELKEALFAIETADYIYDVCEKNEVKDKQITEVARSTGKVLLGVLPPDEFQEDLEKKVGLEKETAKKVAQEINRFIFYPLKAVLEKLYKTEITPPSRPITGVEETTEEATTPSKKKEEPKSPPKKDVYREPVE